MGGIPLFLSYIIPVFNCLSFLRDCIDSITSQNLDSYEIIMVDDGSTDGSGEFCDSVQEANKHVRVIHKQNGGAASARNVGIKAAQGRFLFFIDGDDTIAPDCMEQLMPLLKSENCLPVFGMAFDYWSSGVLQRSDYRSVAFEGQYEIKELAEKLPAFFDDNVLSSACNKVFASSVIREHHLCFPEGVTLYEDLSFVLSYLMHVGSVFCLPRPLYHYRNEINDDHFPTRVAELDKLRQNLAGLNRVLLDFGTCTDAPQPAASVAAELYLQLLSQHLLLVRHSVEYCEKFLPEYCSEPAFRALLKKKPALSENSAALLDNIEQKRFHKLHRQYCIKRAKRSVRRIIKKVLKR